MTMTTEPLTDLSYILDRNGVAHGDLFCADGPKDGSGQWITLPADVVPPNGCACIKYAIPFTNAERYGDSPAGPNVDAPDRRNDGQGTGTAAPTRATEKQVAFIESLLAQLPEATQRELLSQDPTRLDRRTASELIDTLKGAVKNVAAEAPLLTMEQFKVIADGLDRKFTADDLTPELTHFAVEYAKGYTGDFQFMLDMRAAASGGSLSPGMAKGVLNVARADIARCSSTESLPTVTPGRYAYLADDGHPVFVKVWKSGTGASYLAGGGSDGELVEAGNVPRAALATVLGRIADDEHAAAALFGQRAGRCSRCGRGLSDEDNPYFSQGLGPDCGAIVFG